MTTAEAQTQTEEESPVFHNPNYAYQSERRGSVASNRSSQQQLRRTLSWGSDSMKKHEKSKQIKNKQFRSQFGQNDQNQENNPKSWFSDQTESEEGISESSESEEEELNQVYCSNCKHLITSPQQLKEEESSSNQSVESPIKPNTEPLESLEKIIIRPKLMQLHTFELPETKGYAEFGSQFEIIQQSESKSTEKRFCDQICQTSHKYYSFDDQTNQILNLIDPIKRDSIKILHEPIICQTEEYIVASSGIQSGLAQIEIINLKPDHYDKDIQAPSYRETQLRSHKETQAPTYRADDVEVRSVGSTNRKKTRIPARAPSSMQISPRQKLAVDDYSESSYNDKRFSSFVADRQKLPSTANQTTQPKSRKLQSQVSMNQGKQPQFIKTSAQKTFSGSKIGETSQKRNSSSSASKRSQSFDQAQLLSDPSKLLHQFRLSRKAQQAAKVKETKTEKRKMKLHQFTVQGLQAKPNEQKQFVKESERKYRTKEVTISITNNLLSFTQSDQKSNSQDPELKRQDIIQGLSALGLQNSQFGQTLSISTGKNFFSPGTYFQSQVQTMKNNSGEMLNNDYVDRRMSVNTQSVQNRLSSQQCNLVSLLSPDQGTSLNPDLVEPTHKQSWRTITDPSTWNKQRSQGRSQSVGEKDEIAKEIKNGNLLKASSMLIQRKHRQKSIH